MRSTNTLFLSSYLNFLKGAIDDSFKQTNETRIITQSMVPSDILTIFCEIQKIYPSNHYLKSYLKVASGLINHWNTLRLGVSEMNALALLEANGWLDKEDKLTWFRNRTTQDEGVERLLIFLVGVDYTTDKGGLADFFVVSDEKIWNSINANYKIWLKQAIENKGGLVSDNTIELLNNYLIQINKAIPMSLSQKSEFIEHWLTRMIATTEDNELLVALFELLPSYHLPYLSIENNIKEFDAKTKKGLAYLVGACTFISHTNYKSPSRKKSDFQKIERYFDNFESNLMDIEGNEIESAQYIRMVKDFIFNASKETKEKLIKIDMLPLLKALKIKEEKEKLVSKKFSTYNGLSLQTILTGVHDAIVDYQSEYNLNSITSIQIKLTNFKHDFNHNDDEDLTKESLAVSLLNSILGGIDTLISSLSLPKEIAINFVPFILNNSPTFELIKSSTDPQVGFEVVIEGEATEKYPFKWRLSEYQIERLHTQLAKVVLSRLKNDKVVLPVIELPSHIFKAVYYASSTEEACRLLSLGLDSVRIKDLFENYPIEQNPELANKIHLLSKEYYKLLESILNTGRYASKSKMIEFYHLYVETVNCIKSLDERTAKDISRRFYYAFFMIEQSEYFNINNIEQIIVNGFHPAMLELLLAQTDFILDAIKDELLISKNIDNIFIHSEIKSPILILKQGQGIVTHSKSFNWVHFVGRQPQGEVDLYVQSILQGNEQEYDEESQNVKLHSPKEDIIVNMLDDYQHANKHANDGLRILVTNVNNLSSLLNGLIRFFDEKLLVVKGNSSSYSLQISIYTNCLSKLTTVNCLKKFQNDLTERFAKKDRALKIKINHFASSLANLDNDLKNQVQKQQLDNFGLYDIAFNFNFLDLKTRGDIEVAPDLMDGLVNKSNIFPIIYYPKPIFKQQENMRELRLSQRQIQVQLAHTYLTNVLDSATIDKDKQYFVLSKMDYNPKDIAVINKLHEISQWVVNIDEYFDYHLLKKSNTNELPQNRKVISFSSGYGNYGELNITLSTAHHAFEKLKTNVQSHLLDTMPYLHRPFISQLVDKILELNEGLSGVANIKSILGENEFIRNLYGYAWTIKHFKSNNDNIILSEWIPLDAYPHWFKDIDRRPDLLQLSLCVGEYGRPVVFAHLVESKVGSLDLINSAEEQLETGLKHLIKLFAPKADKKSSDRRYWWGQMYRALIARAICEEINTNRLSIALEQLTEGIFDIRWSSSIVLCRAGCNGDSLKMTKRRFLSDDLLESQRNFDIYEFSDMVFEKTLLDDVDWSQITRKIQKPKSVPLQTRQSVLPTSMGDLFDNIDEVDTSDDVILNNNQINPSDTPTTQPILANSVDNNHQVSSTQDNNSVVLSNSLTLRPQPKIDEFINKVQPNEARILIGQSATAKTNIFYHWEYNHSMLANRHMLIFGSSGSGKTYAIQCILSELANVNVSSFIVDYTDGFLTHQSQLIYQQVCKPKEYFVVIDKLPINPFKSYSTELKPGVVINEEPFQVAIRVKNILSSVYKDFGSQQVAIIDKVLEEGLQNNPNYKLEDFLVDLEDSGAKGESVANKIRTLVKQDVFDTTAKNNLYEQKIRSQHAVQVIQLTSIPKDLQRIITEFVLWDLWAYVQKYGHKDKPITIVLDEMQNLDHRPDSPIDKLLREGRKFGISLILATQTISNFNQEQKDRLFQASTKLFFKPATTEIDSFASILNKVHPNLSRTEWATRLNDLNKGQCFFVGYVNDGYGGFKETVAKLNVTALERRNFSI